MGIEVLTKYIPCQYNHLALYICIEVATDDAANDLGAETPRTQESHLASPFGSVGGRHAVALEPDSAGAIEFAGLECSQPRRNDSVIEAMLAQLLPNEGGAEALGTPVDQ